MAHLHIVDQTLGQRADGGIGQYLGYRSVLWLKETEMVHPSEDGLNQAAMSESLHLPHPARLPAQRVPSPAPFRTFQIEQKLDLPRLSVCFHLKLWLVDGSNLIKTFGYRVLEAKDGPAASQISATGGAVDLIFTDVVSPRGMIGADVVAKAKEFGHR